MKPLSDISIRYKLALAVLIAALVALAVVGAAVIVYEVSTFRPRVLAQLTAQADIIAANIHAALNFDDPAAAEENLESLGYFPSITAACVYMPDGTIFARYVALSTAGDFSFPPAEPRKIHRFEGGNLMLFKPIIFNEEVTGCLFIQQQLPALPARMPEYSLMVVFVLLALTAVSMVLFMFMRSVITGPILDLAGTARTISEKKDYTLRGKKAGEDEIGVLVDSFNAMVDELQARERDLRHSEETFRRFVEHFQGIAYQVYVIDLMNYRYLFFYGEVEKITGYTADDFVAGTISWPKLIHPEDLGDIRRESEMLISVPGYTSKNEFRIKHKDGTCRWVQDIRNQIDFNAGTYPRLIQGVVYDITERKEAEEALRESRRHLELAVSSTNIGLWWWDAETDAMTYSPEWKRQLGYDDDDVLPDWREWHTRLHPDDHDRVVRTISAYIEHPWPDYEVEFRMRHKDGSYRWILSRAATIRNEKGKTSYVLGAHLDITEKKKTEEELRASEAKYRDLVQGANSIILQFDTEGRVTFLNEHAQTFFGYSEQDLLGKRMIGTIVPEIDASGRNLTRVIEDMIQFPDRYAVNEYETKKRSGERAVISWANRGLRNQEGVITEILSIGTDITEQKRLEESLRHAQKMEAIGTLAGGIAHDFNNILSAVVGYAELAIMQGGEDNPLNQNLENVISAAFRARDLVSQIITFSRQKDEERKPLRVDLIVKEAIKLLRASLPSTIEIACDLRAEKMTVMAGPVQIHQVLMNLLTNAAHAMQDEGGILALSLEDLEVDTTGPSPVPELAPGAYLRLIVKDTGCGIAPEILPRIFEPYFSTKERGQGTGLGLAVVHGIVKALGGAITVHSEEGKGTTFEVYLPVVYHAPRQMTSVKTTVPRGTERILFVDDEQAIVVAEKIILQGLGYSVTASISSIEALALFSAQPEAFDLIITDYTMPHITGGELTKNILAIRSDIPIILMTGFCERIDKEKAAKLGIRAFIMKPIITRDLAMLIREILDGGQGAGGEGGEGQGTSEGVACG